ncbi:MAG: tryptophan--tRNA ligase [Desulfobacteraceae bacterium]|nr:tryptophan--tRNA ligase [Desulfobacteraceae bacterium]
MSEKRKKPVLLSGIQPTGELMIGNYIGALRNWVALQDQYDSLFVLVDLHALTVRQNPPDLLRRCREFLCLYLACGVDPDRNTIFVQSHVPGHSQLLWILNCLTPMGELKRMTQFKEKSCSHRTNINMGLFDYPVLMAADILLYGTGLVPVGDDQKQHLELARNLAERFNARFGDIFTVPEPYIPVTGARIMSLQDPTSKMSKSDNNHLNYIALLDSPDLIRQKLRRAVTDAGNRIRYDAARPGISNLLNLFSVITDTPVDLVEQAYDGKGYGEFKNDLTEVLAGFLGPIQGRYAEFMAEPPYIEKILREGAAAARARSEMMLEKIHDAMGLIPFIRGKNPG